ncbi:hypothetical protein PG911_18560 [Tenacibaculum ovolyticum]|uniref:hypothetical protein n=1 Tax=Tenacibaculum ovolyticum TaxID=104270 RepID=UPI0022F3AF80|nr:hypothetical protein [Tenacibaculum ovolyticum]WBX76590.1 hypothetical protein PG911_18560 [Tenacibaculum ovolyticum]
MKQNKETLKKHFETGDKPTQQQYSDLIDSYVDSKQSEGKANRRFVINEMGEVNVASEKTTPVYTLSDVVANKLSLLKDGEVVKEVSLISSSEEPLITKEYADTNYSRKIITEKLAITNPVFTAGVSKNTLILAKGVNKLIYCHNIVIRGNVTVAYDSTSEFSFNLKPVGGSEQMINTDVVSDKIYAGRGIYFDSELSVVENQPFEVTINHGYGTQPTTGAGVFTFWVSYEILNL